MRVVLASASPRRAELLRAAGFEIEIVPPGVEEQRLPGEEAGFYVRRLAVAKVLAATALNGDKPIVGADTVVLAEGQLLEKPATDVEAARMLRLLSGRTHEVLTGVAVPISRPAPGPPGANAGPYGSPWRGGNRLVRGDR